MQQQALEPGWWSSLVLVLLLEFPVPHAPAHPERCPALTEPSHAGAALHSQFIVQCARGQAGHGALERAACLCQASRRQEQQQRAGREQRGKVKRKENYARKKGLSSGTGKPGRREGLSCTVRTPKPTHLDPDISSAASPRSVHLAGLDTAFHPWCLKFRHL